MRKTLKWVAVAAIVSAVALVNVKVALDADSTNEWLASLLTFTENGEEGGSNNEGSGKFFYKHLQGDPKTCTLYKYISINGDVSYSTEDEGLGFEYIKIQVQGMYEDCPDKGSGCTVYSCQETN